MMVKPRTPIKEASFKYMRLHAMTLLDNDSTRPRELAPNAPGNFRYHPYRLMLTLS